MATRRRRRRRGPYQLTPEEREARRERARRLHRDGRFRALQDDSPPTPAFAAIAALAGQLEEAMSMGQTSTEDDPGADGDASTRAALEARLRRIADRLAADVERRREVDAQIAESPVLPAPTDPEPVEHVEPETDADALEPEASPLHYPSRLIREPQPEPEPEPEDPAAASAARSFASRLPASRGGTTWRSGRQPGFRYL